MSATPVVAAANFQKKFRYHHGDLKEALLQAALEILRTDGVDGLSLRTLAKATGVTQAAPYSHFRDKNDLLAAIAEAGFQHLALQMAEDATGSKDTKDRVENLVISYIRFAVENKSLFQLMFSRELSEMKNYPTLAMTAGKGYALISAALSMGRPQEDVRFLTVSIWSLCHGLTTLIVDNKLKPEQFGAADTAEFIRRTLAIFDGKIG